MRNKRHNILDDAWNMDSEVLGGAVHTMRVGLVTNTVMNAMPIIIEDVEKLVLEEPVVDHKTLKDDFPVLLHFRTRELTLVVLVVRDEDTDNLQCYPFNNLNDKGCWWLYDMAFDILPSGFIEIRPIHPLVEEFDPTQEMIAHVEALTTLVKSFVHRLQAKEITVYEQVEDLRKINKKRVSKGKEPIVNNWNIEYVI